MSAFHAPLSPQHARASATDGPRLTRRSGYVYERRRPEEGPLYQVVRDHLETLYAAVEDGFANASLPAFVREEFERYLDCGILCRGAGLLVCDQCPATRIIALSCKGRGFCPSCLGRRMAQTSANLVEHVLPRDVPLRQWVVTMPFELRGRLGFDAKLLSAVCRVTVDALLGFYERQLRGRVAPLPTLASESAKKPCLPKLQGGTVTVVQRTNSDFRLNPHLHVLALDGVFAEQPEGPPRFEQLPELTSMDVAEVVTLIRVRVLRLLARRGVIDASDELELLPTELTDREPALAQLAVASAHGLPPAGPERRQREPLRLARQPGATITGPLCATDMGFTLHAATIAKRDDLPGREALCRYVLRPPLAQERVRVLDSGLVRLGLKRAYSDGTVAIEMDPVSFLCRLAASVPGPGFHTVRYGGVLASAATWRPLVVPRPQPDGTAAQTASAANESGDAGPGKPPTHRSIWRPWAELLKRTFAIELRCPSCGGPMKLKAFLSSPQSLRRLLTRLGEPTEAPARAPARGPPYFATHAVRRHNAEASQQADLFDEPA